jgi:hypothetical protein
MLRRLAFLHELRDLRPSLSGPWAIFGDFNLIYQAANKSNGRLSRRMMGRFRRLLNDLELSELHLSGRLFTWSNEWLHPTLERIDRMFVSEGWESLYPRSYLQALSSRCSDHAPLLLQFDDGFKPKRRFRFQSFWPQVQGYLDTMKAARSSLLPLADPLRTIDQRLREMAKRLKAWSAKSIGSIRAQMLVAKEVIFHLDEAQDHRSLSLPEFVLRKFLKLRYLGLTSLQRTIARERSNMRWLKEGDACTKFFHLHANHRRRKNRIDSLLVDGVTLVVEAGKVEAAFKYYEATLGSELPRTAVLDFSELGLPCLDLSELDHPISEEEVWAAIQDLPHDKAPGPDGFAGRFYRSSWSIIKADVVRAFQAISVIDCQSFHHLNEALITLVPKVDNPEGLGDYRPISLIHSFGKIFAKVLANRFAPILLHLISPNQSAFIKGRQIQDNFRYVMGTARTLSIRKIPSVLFKIDLAKAFDSVNWVFLLELLSAVGCPLRWTNWISVLLSTASTKVLLNGVPGRRICHGCGLRQGDPLSPMLFVLVMECFNAMIKVADSRGLFCPLRPRSIKQRVSLYADDVVVFLSPVVLDLVMIRAILDLFRQASGLATNINKSNAFPIRCDEGQLSVITHTLVVSVRTSRVPT